jgi:hypothetical protein
MANTPPRQLIQQRAAGELLEDLCRELRHVAVGEGGLPSNEHVIGHVREVCALHRELTARGIDYGPRLAQLSEETNWQIPPLLDDCLAYPQQLPFVRESDGIRRHLRCQLCSKAERHHDAKLFWFCDACMHRVLNAIQERTPIQSIVLFRTYNAECRCAHADADTVLVGDCYSDIMSGVCERCVREEIERRSTLS